MDVDAYLRRIRYGGPRDPSVVTLCGLHRQHLFNVPFENLDIALGNPIRLDPDVLFQKIVLRKRGGFCYELNGLFHDLLRELGFTVCMLSAQVRREDGGFGPEFDHMLLKVTLEQPWMADVGFGESFVDPLPLASGASGIENGHAFGVIAENGGWELFRRDSDGVEVPLYRFSDRPRNLDEFADMCEYHQTSPDSSFTRRRICTMALPNGRMTLAGTRLIVTQDGKREERILHEGSTVCECLRDSFGVDLGDGADLSKLMA